VSYSLIPILKVDFATVKTSGDDISEPRSRLVFKVFEERRFFLFFNNLGFSFDPGKFRSHADAVLEITELVNKLQMESLPTGKDPPIGNGLHVSFRQIPALCHRFDELAVHIVDDLLKQPFLRLRHFSEW